MKIKISNNFIISTLIFLSTTLVIGIFLCNYQKHEKINNILIYDTLDVLTDIERKDMIEKHSDDSEIKYIIMTTSNTGYENLEDFPLKFIEEMEIEGDIIMMVVDDSLGEFKIYSNNIIINKKLTSEIINSLLSIYKDGNYAELFDSFLRQVRYNI